MRNFLLLALIPATIDFLLSKKYAVSNTKILISFLFIGLVFFITAENVFPNLQPLKIITHRKADFDNLKTANSNLGSFELKPTLSSFLKNSPTAINHGFLRPYIWETKNIFSFLLGLELLLFEALILIAVYFYFKNRNKQKQHFHFLLFYMLLIAGIMIFTTGFIVPNYNSIARYRSLFLPYLLTPILMRFYLIQKSKVKNY